MKLKLFCVAISILLFACNRTDFSNPEDVVKHYDEYANASEKAKLYDNFISNKSKEFATKDEFIKDHNTSDNLDKVANNISGLPVDIDNPTYRRFKVDLTFFVGKGTLRDSMKGQIYYTLINENGKWKIIWAHTLHTFAEKKAFDGNYSEARKIIEKIIELNPFDGDAYERLGWYYYQDNSLSMDERENGMVKNVKYAMALEPDNPSHYNAIAGYYININNYDLAIHNYEKALEYCSRKDEKETIYSNISGCYTSLHLYDKAEEFIKKAINIDSTSTFAWLKYGSLLYDQQKYEKALQYFEKAISLPKMENSMQEKLYAVYAGCCFMTHKCNTAKEYINKALELNPSNSSYQNFFEQIKNCKD